MEPSAIRDWPRVLALARRHRLAPMLWHRLRPAGAAVPTEVRAALEEDARGSAARGARLDALLAQTAADLHAAGIPALAFKGPVLAHAAYPEPWMRRYDDLDFLVRPADVARAADRLFARGYHRHMVLSEGARRLYRRAGWDEILLPDDGRHSVEFTTTVLPRHMAVDLPVADYWARAERVTVEGCAVRTIGAADLALLLAIHGAKHRWDRLAWLTDLHALLRTRPDIPRASVRERAGMLGLQRAWLLALELGHAYLGEPLRAAEAAAIDRDPAVRRLAGLVAAGWWRTGETGGDHLADLRFHLAMRERFADRLRHGIRIAVTPSYADWRLVRLPPGLAFLYYAVRPLRLAAALVRRGARSRVTRTGAS